MSRSKDRIELIKKNVTIQEYFNRVIVPSLSSYYDGSVDFGLRPVCKCPLHDEDTPSFRYYDYSNTFYCFGCGEGGDVISLHMKFMLVNFNEHVIFDDAIDYLYKTFLDKKNKNIKIKYKASGISEEPLSTNLEVIKLNRELDRMEIFLRGQSLDASTLTRVYNYIDTLDKLVHMNLLNATDASNYIKELKNRVKSYSST